MLTDTINKMVAPSAVTRTLHSYYLVNQQLIIIFAQKIQANFKAFQLNQRIVVIINFMQLVLSPRGSKNMELSQRHLKKIEFLMRFKYIDELKRYYNKLKDQGYVFEGTQVFERMSLMLSIHEKVQQTIEILDSSYEGWSANEINDNTKMSVRINKTNIEFRYQQLFDANVENFCIMVYKTTLYKDWVIFCQQSADLNQIDSLQKITYLKFSLPVISDRYSIIHGLAIDRIQQNGTFLIYCEGVTENVALLSLFDIDAEKVKPKKGVLLDIKMGFIEVSRQGSKFLLRGYGHVDTHMPFIPSWSITYIVGMMGKFIANKFTNYVNNFSGSIWQKDMKKQGNGQFYKWLHDKMRHWGEKETYKNSKQQQRDERLPKYV